MYIFLLIQFLFCAVLFATRPLVSLYADSLGASIAVIGLLVSIYAFFPMLLAMKIGKLLDLYGARKITLLGLSLMLLALGIPILLPSINLLFVSQILMGLGQISVLISMTKTFGYKEKEGFY